MAFLDSVLQRVPVDRITVEARRVEFRRVVLTVLAGLLFGMGWAAYRVVAAAWLVLAWCAVAVKVGWVEARSGGDRGPA